MSRALVAALDLGTSSVKAALVTPSGETLAVAQVAYDTTYGSRGEVEQDPRQWWRAVAEALRRCDGRRDEIVALTATGQMQDLVCVDGDDALGPALLYSDTRAVGQHQRLSYAFPHWPRRTGNVQDPSNVAAKIRWLADQVPQRLDQTQNLLFSAAGYVLWRAGAEAACDLTTASSTGLLDVVEQDWYHPLLDHVGVRPEQLPRLVHGIDSTDPVVGRLDPAAAAELGLPAGIPLVMAMGDAGATTEGLVGSAPSSAYLYLGTTGWFAQVVDADRTAEEKPSHLHSLVLPGWDRRLRIGAVLSAGSASAWALSAFLPGLGFAEADARVLARLAAAPASRLLCLPSLLGERTPVRDADARGVFVGMTEDTEPLDLYISVLAGVAMNLRHAAEDMGSLPDSVPLVGGGASSPAWRQIVASVFDTPVLALDGGDPAIMSAARTAFTALGLAHTVRPLSDVRVQDITSPGPEAAAYQQLLPVHRNLYDLLRPAFHTLANLQHDAGSQTP